MASEILSILVKADTSAFGRAMGQAQVSTGKFGKSVGDAESKAKTFGSKLAGFGKIAALGLAGVGLAAATIGKDFVKAAEESQKVTAQTDAVIKSMGLTAQVSAGQIADLSDKLSLKSGVDDELIQSSQNVLLTFRRVAESAGEQGGAFERASKAALNMSVALGSDLQGATLQVGKALNDPIKGLTALTRAGVSFTQAQKDQVKAMVEAGDVAGAQQLILKELEAQFGGSAEAQATASDKLKVAFGNLQETIGEKLLPVVEAFSTWLTETGIPAIESIIGFIEENQTAFTALAVVVGGVLVAAFTAWAVSVIAATWPIIAIGAAVGLVAFLVIKHFDTIKEAFSTAFNWLKENWPLVLGILTGPIGLAVVAIVKHWDTIKGTFTDAVAAIVRGVTGLKDTVKDLFDKAIDWLVTGGKNIVRGLWKGIKAIWQDVIDWFKDLPGKILDVLGINSPPAWAIDAGRWVMRGITKGLGLGIGSVFDFMGGLAAKFTGPLKDAWSGLSAFLSGDIDIGANISGFLDLGKRMSAAFGWTGGQWEALRQLWAGESGWNPSALNESSGAYGIPQALPASKMGQAAQAGNANLGSRAAAQIAWGLNYIKDRYGDPIAALGFWNAHTPHWYGTGGVVEGPAGAARIIGAHGGEGIFTPSQMKALGGNGGSSVGMVVHLTIDNRGSLNPNSREIASLVTSGLKQAGELGMPITIRGRNL